jgi:hypothetical protein
MERMRAPMGKMGDLEQKEALARLWREGRE